MKTPLLLLAGWAHGVGHLQSLAEMLAFRFDVRSVAPHELWAESDRPPFFASGALRRIAALPVPPLLAGWSMGALVALDTATQPDAPPPAGLVMVSGTCRFCADDDYPCGQPREHLRALRAQVLLHRDPALNAFFREAALPRRMSREEAAERTRAAWATGPEALLAGLDYLDTADVRPRLRTVEFPSLWLHGQADRVIPCGAAAWAAVRLPRARVRIRESAGHDLPAESAAWTARAILEFADQERIA